MSHIKYQPEVDGLRAVAILSVIVFHANESWLPGGFIGVDMFFVISGYLIAMILMANSAMTSRTFLMKRVKRILPAYLVVLVAVLAAGVLLMSTEALYQLSKKVAAALFQVTNITSLSKASYFNTSSLEKPLLHTWSLAVEWQFYLLVALLLYVFHKGLKAQTCIVLITMLALASFCVSVYFSLNLEWASHAYYNFASRFWEFSVGILTAYICFSGFSKYARLASYIGAVLFTVGLFLISSESAFPGYWALLPVVGTALIIYGSQADNAIKSMLSGRGIVYCGALSYSLYLWHWPVFSLLRYVTSRDELSMLSILICLPIILLLSLCSYYLVEKRSNHPDTIKRIKLASAAIFIVCLGLVLSRGGSHFADKAFETTKSKIQCQTGDVAGCGDVDSDVKVLLTGDSHAWHFGATLEKISQKEHWHMSMLGLGACAPLLTDGASNMLLIGKRKQACQQQRNYLRDNYEKYQFIFLAARWDSVFKEEGFANVFRNTLETLSKSKAKVFVIAQVPMFKENGTKIAFLNQRYGLDVPVSNVVQPVYTEANEMIKGLVDQYPEVDYIDVNAMFCNEAECSNYIGSDFAYIDNNHLNIWAAKKLVPEMHRQIMISLKPE